MSDIAEQLRRAAAEIEAAGHNGWGNTCLFGAEEVERLRSEQKAAPEMLAALKNVRARFQGLRLDPDKAAVLDRVNAVIAEAEGRKP